MSDQYLKQIRELYGDELYLEFDLNMNDNSTISHSKINYESDLDAFNNQINACQVVDYESCKNFVRPQISHDIFLTNFLSTYFYLFLNFFVKLYSK